MDFRSNDGVQWPLVSLQILTHDMTYNVDADNQVRVVKLPPGAILRGATFVVETASDDTALVAFNLGTKANSTLFATGLDPKTEGETVIDTAGYVSQEGDNVMLEIAVAGNGDGTQGAAYLTVEYVVIGRANEVQTH